MAQERPHQWWASFQKETRTQNCHTEEAGCRQRHSLGFCCPDQRPPRTVKTATRRQGKPWVRAQREKNPVTPVSGLVASGMWGNSELCSLGPCTVWLLDMATIELMHLPCIILATLPQAGSVWQQELLDFYRCKGGPNINTKLKRNKLYFTYDKEVMIFTLKCCNRYLLAEKFWASQQPANGPF